MKKFKRFLLGLVFTKEQKQMIWDAILFSNYTYKKRNDICNADKSSKLVSETESLFTEENA